MKIYSKILAVVLSLPAVVYAQEAEKSASEVYPNTFTSGSSRVEPFTNKSKRFNDWAVSAGAGTAIIQSADLNSLGATNRHGNMFGYSFYFSVDKAITHAFGLKLQYDKGETNQGDFNPAKGTKAPGLVAGRTQYDAISVLGDINFSNLLRRVDNKSNYRWALHGYAGVGTLAYRAYQYTINSRELISEIKPFAIRSLFFQAGTGLKYKINNKFDVEARLMYVYTNDDSFDAGGDQYSDINRIQEPVSDNMMTATLGVTYKIGKHQSHLFWHDPMQELYYKVDVLANQNHDVEVCKSGDKDNDGVCDDWDRQLDTPAHSRVDGAGVALDVDLDGVIDLYDKCVTVPGPVENNGCPIEQKPVQPIIVKVSPAVVEEINKNFEGIEFALGKDIIRPQSFPKLNQAAEIIKGLDRNEKYLVVGATDTRGSADMNMKLSQRRANAVVKYLVSKGVPASMLKAEGRGKNDLKYPECDPATNCEEWKNEANRRVFFEAK